MPAKKQRKTFTITATVTGRGTADVEAVDEADARAHFERGEVEGSLLEWEWDEIKYVEENV